MKVEFKFELKQHVKTIFGDIGIIESAAVNGNGKQYYIQRSQENKWFREDQLFETRKILGHFFKKINNKKDKI